MSYDLALPRGRTRGLAMPRVSWSRAVAGLGLAALVVYAVVVPLTNMVPLTDVSYQVGARPPSLEHLFGTDLAGRDLFVRCAYGLRVSILVALAGAFSAIVLGSAVGLSCGLIGGRFDRLVMRIVDGINSLPHLLLGIVIAATFRGSLLAIIMVVALTHWPQTARLARAELLAISVRDHYRAAITQGFTRAQLLRHHVLPRLFSQLSVAFGLLIPHAIWHESTLTFLGLGLPPHQPSLGSLLNLGQQALLTGSWWTLAAPAGLLIITTVAITAVVSPREHRHG
ncbi:ABC transporter permease [Brooklawnia sp.]|uniref:ABC transporter permease n=1 Tax=Brooklawnia sp. TaxID=2699740 RepID=UPI00311E7E9E